MSEQARSVVDKKGKREALPTVDPQKELVKKPLKQFPRCQLLKKEREYLRKRDLVNLRVNQEEFNQQEGEKRNDPTTKENGDEEKGR